MRTGSRNFLDGFIWKGEASQKLAHGLLHAVGLPLLEEDAPPVVALALPLGATHQPDPGVTPARVTVFQPKTGLFLKGSSPKFNVF